MGQRIYQFVSRWMILLTNAANDTTTSPVPRNMRPQTGPRRFRWWGAFDSLVQSYLWMSFSTASGAAAEYWLSAKRMADQRKRKGGKNKHFPKWR